ncbi:calcineurin-like phosphoesterase family protein [Corynebacterium breve]|uniref:Calcineurin-like phosphoesterase family protein n=1 Tax=Corynebacterium breve TaxID=3049799 RepID=A0ABY8VDQ1_9CORY|nr:calcineurin-like phosphoesterase family protein [Corynebacterium breve]WIM67467.1 calcineurin-like phosphoesterase family protein [Corynebacterium breve]
MTFPTRKIGILAAISLASTLTVAPFAHAEPIAGSDAYVGGPEVIEEAPADNVLEGVVFDDQNKNSIHDSNEPGIEGVSVSNGKEIVTTDAEGRYEITVEPNTTVFITQPAGYQVPVDENNIAQFFYNHSPEGSPDLKYGGIAPTGPLPEMVNFPLAASEATAAQDQRCIIGGDIQPYNTDEVEYARKGAFADLAARDDYASCGVLFVGDVVGDDLALYEGVRSMTSELNGPARMLPGNHDLDFDAPDETHKFDTFRREFGPAYYSYDVGNAHVIALESVEYPQPDGKGYRSSLTDDQMAWLRQDIANTPDDKVVVIASHIGLVSFVDSALDQHQIKQVNEVHALLEGRDAIHVAGHTHALSNMRKGDSLKGWKDLFGMDELPFDHVIAGAISGDWYNGRMTDKGFPTAIARDGSRPGVMTLDVNGSDISSFFTVSGEDQSTQLGLGLNTPAYRDWFAENRENGGKAQPLENPLTISQADLAETWLTTNFWFGGSGDVVEVSIDGAAAVEAKRTQDMAGEDVLRGVEYSDPAAVQEQLVHGGSVAEQTSSLWTLDLPEDLAAGEHTAEVTATDVNGNVYTETLTFTVEGSETDSPVEAPAKDSIFQRLINMLKRFLGALGLSSF